MVSERTPDRRGESWVKISVRVEDFLSSLLPCFLDKENSGLVKLLRELFKTFDIDVQLYGMVVTVVISCSKR